MLNRGDNIVVEIDILHNDGYSVSEIAMITGIDETAIRRILRL